MFLDISTCCETNNVYISVTNTIVQNVYILTYTIKSTYLTKNEYQN